jgi:hypothetical protein|uniref:Uncharacterized protein n=1 Tax=Bathycoccus sp. RCC716 virus 2 TaxID=2530039 RepID=A0A7S6NYI5_9PHYC|nr:hypothetical protein [Bathycoccus sp. RCC716 virus 2]|tara:strand:+ start:4853 stop:5251 length:399 start_codon:yes stop_codon:yes gene_type:complete
MAYQLQPGLKIVEDKAVPKVCATEEVFVYPQPSTLNYGSSRPNTMLYGTAPFMAGKGSPAQFIETSDALRPQSTSQFNKILAKTYEKNFHPLQNVECKVPLRTRTYEPSSTRAEVQNGLFQQRYVNKNLAKK